MTHDHPVHIETPRKRLIGTILLNVAITIAEFLGGLITGYLALMADAVHNLSDVASLLLAWLGMTGAKLPATKKSTYGYKRVEVMTAFISAVALVVIAVFIIMKAYDRIVSPEEIREPGLFLTIAGVGLIGNLVSVWLLSAHRGSSLNMKAAFLHMAYDAASSGAVIAGGVFILIFGWVIVDPILSTIIALMIVWSSYQVIKDAVLVFMEAVPSGIDFDEVRRSMVQVEHVNDVHDLHIWSLSSTEAALSCHVVVSHEHFARASDIMIELNRLMCDRFGIYHSTIQIERDECVTSDLSCRHPGDGEV
jgi:cobalt-zinc-cadmium efflux system protein